MDTAFSRVGGGGYVQDRVAENAEALRQLTRDGAEIFVCGGVDMARGVRDAFDILLTPLGLKSQGRYSKMLIGASFRRALNGPTMGTRYSAVFFSPPRNDPESIRAALQRAVDEVDDQMSSWK